MSKLSVGTFHTILHDHFNLSKVNAKWVPWMLIAWLIHLRSVVKIQWVFSTRLLLEMKRQLIAMILRASRSFCSEWAEPPESLKSWLENLWLHHFRTQNHFLWVKFSLKMVIVLLPHLTQTLVVIWRKQLKRKGMENWLQMCYFSWQHTGRLPRLLCVTVKKLTIHPPD